MLTLQQAERWEVYQKTEARGARADKLAALEEFLVALGGSPQADREPWARDLARRIVDAKEDIAVRMPLFRQAVLPALLSGLLAGEPGCTRWLAGLTNLLHQCPDCAERLPEDLRTGPELLRHAVREDPNDATARRLFIEQSARWHDYSLHELPAGVLDGNVGVTPDQCTEMLADLDEFAALVDAAGERARYGGLIDRCRLHFAAYRNHLFHRPDYLKYADYLTRHGLPLR